MSVVETIAKMSDVSALGFRDRPVPAIPQQT
jgi:hypothetical protein